MPPVMGSAAFLIADAIGVPYPTLMKHALIPAMLYFTGIWVMVHFEAKKSGLRGCPGTSFLLCGPSSGTRVTSCFPSRPSSTSC